MAFDPESILNSTKKAIGLIADYDPFDPELIMYINSAFGTLAQLGVGPAEGFTIEGDDATWDEFTMDKRYGLVRSYIAFKVKLAFDPPSNSFTQEALKQQIQEHEWRLNVLVETASLSATTSTTT